MSWTSTRCCPRNPSSTRPALSTHSKSRLRRLVVPRYELPKLPGTFNMLVESFRDPPPAPPVLTSDPPNFPSKFKCNPSPPPPFTTPKLGTVGQRVLSLWHKCTDNSDNRSFTCMRLLEQFNF